MKKSEKVAGSDVAGPLTNLPLGKVGADQEGIAGVKPEAGNSGTVRSDLPLFRIDDRGAGLAGRGLRGADPDEVRSAARRRSRELGSSDSSVGRSESLPFENRTGRLTERGAVATPITLKQADTVSRLGAGVVDLLIITGIDAVVLLLTSRLAGVDLDGQSTATLLVPPLFLFLLLLDLGYVLTLTRLSGQTLGKMLFSIRVVNVIGGEASTRQIIIRTFGWLISVLLLGIGFLFLFIGKKRGLHDLAAGTNVVYL